MTKLPIWQILRSISVEPVILCNAIAISYHNVIFGFGIYRVVCQKLFDHHADVDCDDLSHHNSTSSQPELQVQRVTADWRMATTLSYVIPATFADIFLSGLADKYGRKYNILLGIFGMMLAVFPCAILFAYPKWASLYILIIANFLAGLTGFVAMVVISSCAYLADTVVDKDLLTVRMTLIQVFINVGYIFGPLLSSATTKLLNRAEQECVTLSLLAIAFVLAWILLRQIPPAEMRRKRTQQTPPVAAGDQIDQSPASAQAEPPARLVTCWTCVRQGFSSVLSILKDVWLTFSKKREGHGRAYMLSAFGIFLISFWAELGLQQSVFTLYVQKAPLNWDQEMIGYYNSANNAVTVLGTSLGIIIFKKFLNLADTTVLLIALASGIGESIVIALADRTWMLFLSAVVGSLSMLTKPCLKSFVAKLVDAEEVGKAFIIFGIAQNIAYFSSSVVFSRLYKATLEIFPGFVYVFAAFIVSLMFLLLIWMHVDQKRTSGQKLAAIAWVFQKETNKVAPVEAPVQNELI